LGQKLYGAHQLLVCADDVNLLGDKIDTKTKTQKLIFASSALAAQHVRVIRVVCLPTETALQHVAASTVYTGCRPLKMHPASAESLQFGPVLYSHSSQSPASV
jgi:hypothetical protein